MYNRTEKKIRKKLKEVAFDTWHSVTDGREDQISGNQNENGEIKTILGFKEVDLNNKH
jgi:hypothetical protein